ncbi:MAG: MFS transporter [Minisyncoccia bacterium]
MVLLKNLFREKLNEVAKNLLLVNILNITGWAFVNPIFAIFVLNRIEGATIKTVGLCYFFYWIIKATLQLFISDYLDRVKGEADDFFALLIGQMLNTLVPILLMFSHNVLEVFIIFIIYGIGDALGVPPWNSLFTRHINPKRISFEWALNSTGFNLGSALAILIGTSLVYVFGFSFVFFIVFICQFIGLILLISIRRHFLRKIKEPIDYFFTLKS